MPREFKPNQYIRVFMREVEPLRATLTQGQCQNLIGAMVLYFFFRTEPHGLPKQAKAIFEVERKRLDRYRNSVLNGSENKGEKSPSLERNLPQNLDQDFNADSSQDFDTDNSGPPAQT